MAFQHEGTIFPGRTVHQANIAEITYTGQVRWLKKKNGKTVLEQEVIVTGYSHGQRVSEERQWSTVPTIEETNL